MDKLTGFVCSKTGAAMLYTSDVPHVCAICGSKTSGDDKYAIGFFSDTEGLYLAELESPKAAKLPVCHRCAVLAVSEGK